MPDSHLPTFPAAAAHPAIPHPMLAPARTAGGGASSDEEDTIPWGRYRAALMRHKWLIATAAILGLGLGFIAMRFVNPSYESSAQIWINADRQATPTRGPIRSGELLREQAWADLVKSRAVLHPVVERLRLYVWTTQPGDSVLFRNFATTSTFRPGAYILEVDPARRHYTLTNKASKAVVDSGLLGGRIGAPVGMDWTPEVAPLLKRRTVEFSASSPRSTAAGLQARLSAKLPEGTNFLTLTLTGSNPDRTALILNAIADQFIETAADLKRRNLVEMRRVLETQVDVAEQQLRDTERRFRSFRSTTITLPNDPGMSSETQDPMLSTFFTQKIEQENLRRDRGVIEGLLAEARAGTLGMAAAVALPPTVEGSEPLRATLTQLAAAEADLRTARQFYTDEHKTVQDLQRTVSTLRTRELPIRLQELATRLRRREQDVASRVQGSSRELAAIPARTVDAMRLRREMTVAENMYTTLQSRYEEAKLAEASAIPDVSLLDAAIPPTLPKSNTKPMILIAALLLGLGIGIAIAIVRDRVDHRFRYPEQATKELGLQILGAIPGIQRDPRRAEDPEEAAQVVEAFRTLRLGLIGTQEEEGPFVLTITSPGPGDGKSMLSSNLALSFAEAGYRTLLIDGDIRRGELHNTFGTDRRPGLVDHLSGPVTLAEVIRPTESHPNLHIIPCGTRRHRAPELLASTAMPQLLATLRHEYSVVLIDSPPLSAGIDPYALATVARQVLIVLRPGRTDRKLAAAKIELLDRLRVRVLGAVLNDIQGESQYRYYSYEYGYTVPDEEGIDSDMPKLGARVGELAGRT